jgi:hypothetical protein
VLPRDGRAAAGAVREPGVTGHEHPDRASSTPPQTRRRPRNGRLQQAVTPPSISSLGPAALTLACADSGGSGSDRRRGRGARPGRRGRHGPLVRPQRHQAPQQLGYGASPLKAASATHPFPCNNTGLSTLESRPCAHGT